MVTIRPFLSRWFLPGLASIFVGITLALVGIDPNHGFFGALFEGGSAFILSGVLFVVGYRYVTTAEAPETGARTVALWTLAGVGLSAVLIIWFRVLRLIGGPVELQFVVVTALTAGSLGGAIVGISIVQARRRHAEREQALADYQELFDKAEDGIFIDDPESGRILDVNQRGAEMLGYTVEELEGEPIAAISADDPEFSNEQAMEKMQQAIDGKAQRFDWLIERKDGTTQWVEVSLKTTTLSGERRLIAHVRDISDRKAYEQNLERAEQRFRSFAENSSFGVVTIDETSTVQYANHAVEDLLGYEPADIVGTSLTTIMPERFRSQHEAGLNRYVAEGTRHLDWNGIELPGLHEEGHEVPLEISFGELTFGDEQLFTGILRDVTERKRHERQIANLHDATRKMVQATTMEEVCEVSVQTVETTLDFPITGIWLSDESGDQLEPAAATDLSEELFGDHPVYTEGNSLSWRAYETGESLRFDDLQAEPELYNPNTQVRSELILPLGEYGVLNVGSKDPNTFSDNDLALAKLLAANTEVALGRAERERELKRHTDQMGFFNSILRHDVLNAVTVIKSRAEFLQEDLDGDQLRDAQTIVKWSNDVKEIVQQVRTVVETLTGAGDPELGPVDLRAELRAEVDRIQSTYPDVTFDTTVPDDVPVLANDLLGDVLGNLITNAIDHNDIEGLRVSIAVEYQDGTVITRIADNGQGVSDDRKDAIFRRDETGHVKSTGSGFGLYFVDIMVAEYGGDVWVENNDDGGATFVVRLAASDQAALT